jgi:tetratricopeptide (TPR) repeat protein
VTGERAGEEDALGLALEALEIADRAGQGFTAAAAREAAAAACRRLWRLDAAAEHADAAVRTLRELGARWELAGALGERGAVMRLLDRLDEAEADLREAYVLCRDLRDRALVSWTAAELARTLALRGDVAGAEQILGQPLSRIGEGEGGASSSLLLARSFVDHLAGDREAARAGAQEAVADLRALDLPNRLSAALWWTGSLFGPEDVGGNTVVEEARERLQRNGWIHALRAPDLVSERT